MAFADRDLVLSAEDPKTDSSWQIRKDRVDRDTSLDVCAILSISTLYAPGSCAAVPVAEQKKLDGDFDGDADLLLFGYEALFQHIKQFESAGEKSTIPLKPQKTHTPAIRMSDDSYQFGRASQILATRAGVLEKFIGLQRTFLAQPGEGQLQLAKKLCFALYEGIEENHYETWSFLLTQAECSLEDLATLIQEVRAQQDTGDIHPEVSALLKALKEDLQTWRDNLAGSRKPRKSSFPRVSLNSILRRLPVRMLSPEVGGYRLDNPVQTIRNLLSLGIKTGTDAYKSNTGVQQFQQVAEVMQQVFREQKIALGVYYSKSTLHKLVKGCFDPQTAQKALAHNPTLAAEVMSSAIEKIYRQGRLPGNVTVSHPPDSRESKKSRKRKKVSPRSLPPATIPGRREGVHEEPSTPLSSPLPKKQRLVSPNVYTFFSQFGSPSAPVGPVADHTEMVLASGLSSPSWEEEPEKEESPSLSDIFRSKDVIVDIVIEEQEEPTFRTGR